MDLGELPELEPEVACFLGELTGNLGEESEKGHLKTPVEEFGEWVPWKAETCEMPGWWKELKAVLEVEDHERLAREVQASFQLPRRIRELHPKKDGCQAPPVPLCLWQKKFMPPTDAIYTCRDICEIPWEKMVVYSQALQHWAEKTDLPAGGKPHLLAGSVRELKKELCSYLPFSDEEVFKGLALPEETSLKEVTPQSMSTCTLEGGAGTEANRELAGERRAPKFLGWEKFLHPSWPVVAAGEVPHLLRGPRPREE